RLIEAQPHRHVLVTHGTDTMVETAAVLASIKDKVIVLTGALNPARFQGSDAVFNIGCAVGAVQSLPDGVYIAMNGRIWNPAHVRKNRDANRFEAV
ncbi:asparaginase domain-containing protein, partial [Dokdonella sp.]